MDSFIVIMNLLVSKLTLHTTQHSMKIGKRYANKLYMISGDNTYYLTFSRSNGICCFINKIYRLTVLIRELGLHNKE